jgi:hypothetical protein
MPIVSIPEKQSAGTRQDAGAGLELQSNGHERAELRANSR